MDKGKLLTVIFCLAGSQALASTATYDNSAAFDAALVGPPAVVEQFSTLTNGTIVNPGSILDGITFSSFDLSEGTQGLISNQFNSFSGVSLGADQSGGAAQFFFDGDSFVINFAPTYAIGVFYNVNLNSGTFGITTSSGNAVTSSAAYDTSTFVFAGLVSSTPFTSATIYSTSGGSGTASYNIPEIVLAMPTPEPASIALTALGAGLLALFARRRRAV